MKVRKLEFILRKLPSWVLVGASWLALALVAWADHLSGQDLQLEFFYLLPLAAVSWLCGRRDGLVTAGLATVLWTLVDVTGRPVRSQPGLIVWNAAVELLFFSGLAILVSFMARQADNLRSLAREDALTGVANRRAFFGALTNAVDLAGRREGAWTITYVDLDDFKQINDRLGHNTGDDVLRAVAGTLKAATRRVDVVARLGGDEFGVLMPDTDQAQAETAVRKLQALLDAAMADGGWPITFSIGATTFLDAPASPDAALAVADAQMYEVKHESKAAVRFGVWDGRTVGR
ncbi:MAG TPA: GGDEF domain-containing protein [Gemmatimonadales bacterium]|nr:GGDEF domain-containing protein [Gemmatimonadales bacterium]